MDRIERRRATFRLICVLSVLALAIACDSGGSDDGSGGGTEGGGGGGAGATSGGDDFALAAGFAAASYEGRSGGNRDASEVGDSCMGTIAAADSPDHVITVTGSVDVILAVHGGEGSDTTLVVTGTGGPFCSDDDSGLEGAESLTLDGLDPAVRANLSAGTYQVFVGNYDSEAGGVNYTLHAIPAPAAPVEEAPTSAPTEVPPADGSGAAAPADPAVPTTAPNE